MSECLHRNIDHSQCADCGQHGIHIIRDLEGEVKALQQQVRALERAASAREELVQKSRMDDRQHRTTT
jgi:hypothetical protein